MHQKGLNQMKKSFFTMISFQVYNFFFPSANQPICSKALQQLEKYNKIIKMSSSRKTQYILPPLREKIDHYSYVGKESIGKGFSSSVYRGRDDQTQQQVAIKVIDMKTMKGQIHKNLLAGEIEILSLIKNRPNLLDVHKICSDKNKTYIITDFCEGGDLGKLIKSRKKLNEAEATRIIRQIIKGYESLYSLGIVHRDLKPANIFFHNSQLEIGDFGFAVKQENLKTTQKYNVGSPVYMPPQALNSNKYSHKSDIWAIGVIFFEMLTGTTPWTGRTEAELKTKMKTISIKTLIPPAINKTSSSFLKRALETDITKRMDPFQMFEHFDISHENDEQFEPAGQQFNPRLFRSMRKATRNQLFDQTSRGESMKKTTNTLAKRTSFFNPENLHGTGSYGPAPKTALQTKPEPQHMSAIQKRIISKQLLSQIHFCRFLYKLISNIESGISCEVDRGLLAKLIQLLFYKLQQTKQLRLIGSDFVQEYSQFADYKKLQKLCEQYHSKYSKKLGTQHSHSLPPYYTAQMYMLLLNQLSTEIKQMYGTIAGSRQPNYLLKQIIVLDYFITLSQLIDIGRSGSLEQFHSRSKIQAIVDGESIGEVTAEHVRMIGNKLRILKML